jgi:acetolactate decarboxylase
MTLSLRRSREPACPQATGANRDGAAPRLPSLAQVLRRGDHGMGVLDTGRAEFMIVRGRCFTLEHDFSVTETATRARAHSAAVTRFDPEARISFRRPVLSRDLLPQLEATVTNSPGGVAVRIDGWFSFVRIRHNGAMMPIIREVSDVTGTIIGFSRVDMDVPPAPADLRLYFVDESRRVGGRVVDFEVLQAVADLASLVRTRYRA